MKRLGGAGCSQSLSAVVQTLSCLLRQDNVRAEAPVQSKLRKAHRAAASAPPSRDQVDELRPCAREARPHNLEQASKPPEAVSGRAARPRRGRRDGERDNVERKVSGLFAKVGAAHEAESAEGRTLAPVRNRAGTRNDRQGREHATAEVTLRDLLVYLLGIEGVCVLLRPAAISRLELVPPREDRHTRVLLFVGDGALLQISVIVRLLPLGRVQVVAVVVQVDRVLVDRHALTSAVWPARRLLLLEREDELVRPLGPRFGRTWAARCSKEGEEKTGGMGSAAEAERRFKLCRLGGETSATESGDVCLGVRAESGDSAGNVVGFRRRTEHAAERGNVGVRVDGP